MEQHKPKPFTYYRNNQERRAFLVVDVEPTGELDNKAGRVLLMEWGKEPAGKWVPYADFLALVEKKMLERFTPNYSDNAQTPVR